MSDGINCYIAPLRVERKHVFPRVIYTFHGPIRTVRFTPSVRENSADGIRKRVNSGAINYTGGLIETRSCDYYALRYERMIALMSAKEGSLPLCLLLSVLPRCVPVYA